MQKKFAPDVAPPLNQLSSTRERHLNGTSRSNLIGFLEGVAGRAGPVLLLTEIEKGQLEESERTLERGLGTFYEVGNALLTIRESRLYRLTHSSFERYCLERWNIGRSYAWRVIGAAERLNLLPKDQTASRPTNEFQVRPFLKLAAKEFP